MSVDWLFVFIFNFLQLGSHGPLHIFKGLSIKQSENMALIGIQLSCLKKISSLK